MSYINNTYHIPSFGGNIWYVNKNLGNNSNSGKSPQEALETIGYAISICNEGDAINIKAGIYTETGLNLNKNSVEIWSEIGTIIDPSSGTVLTISGNYCRIKGDIDINVPDGEIGLLILGDYCNIGLNEGATIHHGSIGISINGMGCTIHKAACGYQTTSGFSITGHQARLFDCHTVSNLSTKGFYIGGGANTGVLRRCTSTGHGISGFYIDTGSESWTLLNCSSGAGDGKYVDIDSANVWSNFMYNDNSYHPIIFNADGPSTRNIFKISGTVLITKLFGHIFSELSSDIGNVYLELYDGTNTIDVTDSPGPSFNSLPVGSYIHKIDDAGIQIKIENSSQVRLYEDATKNGRNPNFQIIAKEGVDTYLRLVYSGIATSGIIHFHCQWEPLTEKGFVEGV